MMMTTSSSMEVEATGTVNVLSDAQPCQVWQDDLVNELERLLDSATANSGQPEADTSTMNSWDDDVLLSQSQLPEDQCEPLMELGADNALTAILGDWNHFQDGITQGETWTDSKCGDWFTSDMNSNQYDCKEDIDLIVRDSLQDVSAKNSALAHNNKLQSNLGRMGRKLVGIVISSGPDNHFETFEVIEAPGRGSSSPVSSLLSSSSVETTPAIMHAVQSHFSESNGKALRQGSVPKIVSSEWIKDALPIEVIERIKASSQRSKTISIIEPIELVSQHNTSPRNDNAMEQTVPSSFSSMSGTRFQEAAVLLNKSKRRHQMQCSKSSLQAQVSLDHDYCTNRNKRNARNGSSVLLHRSRPTPALTTGSIQRGVLTPNTTLGRSSGSDVIRVKHEIGHVGEPLNFPVSVETALAPDNLESTSISRKDSGLESGEENSNSSGNENSSLYSKLPSYLTSFTTTSNEEVGVVVKTEPVEEEDASNVYNRLPSYFIPVEKSCSKIDDDDCNDYEDELVREANRASSSSSSSFRHSSRKRRFHSRRRLVHNRRRSMDRSDSGSDSESLGSKEPMKKAGRDGKRRRLRSPVNRRYVGSAEERSLIGRESSSSPLQMEKSRQVEERRVIYVGRVPEGTTRAQLRERFDKFGPVEEISLHFRDHGDNYGFVTFRNREDAYEAIDKGNDDTRWPRVDLCFGGRRSFCKESYADLDSQSKGGNFSKAVDFKKLQRPRQTTGDFDALLNQVKSRMRSERRTDSGLRSGTPAS